MFCNINVPNLKDLYKMEDNQKYVDLEGTSFFAKGNEEGIKYEDMYTCELEFVALNIFDCNYVPDTEFKIKTLVAKCMLCKAVLKRL